MPDTYIYVLSADKRPLMPTKRHRHIQKLLKRGKARVAMHVPFTVQLKYQTAGVTQPLYGGTDPGRTNIGNAVVDANGNVVYKDRVETRNKDIAKLMQERAKFRRASRRGERLARKRLAKRLGTTREFIEGRMLPGYKEPVMLKDIINTEARFNNRKRPVGWLTPSARQLVRTHVNMVKRICRILPVTHWTLETNRFAFMLMEDGSVHGIDFQNGRLRGFRSVDDYIDYIQGGKCAVCGCPIGHHHHIVPRSEGGSDRPENIVGLCLRCHEKVHVGEFDLSAIGERKKYAALSVLNQAIPFICEELGQIFGNGYASCTGYETAALRGMYGIAKDHDNDAVCIAIHDIAAEELTDRCHTFRVKQYRRHDRSNIKAQRERTYYLDGKAVAKNRRPRFEQNGKALSDLCLTREETSRLTVKAGRRYYNDRRRMLPGMEFVYHGERHIMSGQHCHGAYIRAVATGTKDYRFADCHVLRYNCGLVYL